MLCFSLAWLFRYSLEFIPDIEIDIKNNPKNPNYAKYNSLFNRIPYNEFQKYQFDVVTNGEIDPRHPITQLPLFVLDLHDYTNITPIVMEALLDEINQTRSNRVTFYHARPSFLHLLDVAAQQCQGKRTFIGCWNSDNTLTVLQKISGMEGGENDYSE